MIVTLLTLVVALLLVTVVGAFVLGLCAALILVVLALISAVRALGAAALAGARRLLVLGSGGAGPPCPAPLASSGARAQASALLAESYAAGALELPELESRIEAALHANTEAELAGACAGLAPLGRGAGGSPLAAVGIALVLLGSPSLVRVTGGALVAAALVARGRDRLALAAFASGLLALVSLPASIAVAVGGLWGSRSARQWIVSRGILTPR